MATPAERTSEFESYTPELSVVVGGLAVERSVHAVSDMSEEDFKDYVHSVLSSDNELQTLIDIDHSINAASAQLNIEIAGLTQRLHELYTKKRWVSGYIGDRVN